MIIRERCHACGIESEHVFFCADVDGLAIEVVVCRSCGKDKLEVGPSHKSLKDKKSHLGEVDCLKTFAERETL